MMLQAFDTLAARLREESAGRRVVYIPNPGNFGDGLIRYATKQFLADYGIGHYELNVGYSFVRTQLLPHMLRKDMFFIYGGGGAWSGHYDFGWRNASFIARFTDKLLVLPSTYALSDMPRRGIFYRRDEAQSAEIHPASAFCHDMAFYAAVRPQGRPSFLAPDRGTGMFLRTDRESALDTDNLPADNEDISLLGDHMSNGDDFLARIARHDMIITDRLHVCIGACIVGRPVKLIGGNYFKIRAIYDTSIAPHFGDRVELVDDIPGEALARAS